MSADPTTLRRAAEEAEQRAGIDHVSRSTRWMLRKAVLANAAHLRAAAGEIERYRVLAARATSVWFVSEARFLLGELDTDIEADMRQIMDMLALLAGAGDAEGNGSE